jgi:redox-sensitive bicupin YhaK (pirin superfamily)
MTDAGSSTDDLVVQTFPLGFQWPTVDPFLFCVHHLDHYPAGNEQLGPDASLAGRDLGQDFSGIDGWRMYHGEVVPGFPQHPHRGFETVTFVRQGLIDHSDSLGATARFGRGDVQWLTAGQGIVHCEMFPLLDRAAPNPVELFQIWLNLPPEDKLVEPHFTMLWDADIPRRITQDHKGRAAVVTVVAGRLGDVDALPPPPHSWAARADADVAIWHVQIDAGATCDLPATDPNTVRVLYLFEGDDLSIASTHDAGRGEVHVLGTSTGAALRPDRSVRLSAGDGPIEALVLQGRPIGAPVARYGPFVMNTEAEIRQAFADYDATGFGGWPWTSDDPVHGPERGRFAQHADGRLEASATLTRR